MQNLRTVKNNSCNETGICYNNGTSMNTRPTPPTPAHDVSHMVRCSFILTADLRGRITTNAVKGGSEGASRPRQYEWHAVRMPRRMIDAPSGRIVTPRGWLVSFGETWHVEIPEDMPDAEGSLEEFVLTAGVYRVCRNYSNDERVLLTAYFAEVFRYLLDMLDQEDCLMGEEEEPNPGKDRDEP